MNGTRWLRLLGFHAYQVCDSRDSTGLRSFYDWVECHTRLPLLQQSLVWEWRQKPGSNGCQISMCTLEIALRVTLRKTWWKTGLVTAWLFYFTPYTRESWLKHQWWPVIVTCTRQSVLNYGCSGKRRIIHGCNKFHFTRSLTSDIWSPNCKGA